MSWVDDTNVALFADLYELTMAASYHAHDLDQPATFDLFARHLPPRRGYLVSCGLDTALEYLENLQVDDAALDYLGSLDLFDESFLSMLSGLRFTGEVRAIPEGELVFPNEPIVQVTAPLVEAQLVETFLLNCIGYQTMIATKAARVATACGDRTFVDFSPRRDHGTDAALKTARAAYVGGAVATSLVLGGQVYGLELSGTMAHSYVMRFDNEADAFLTYARDFPGRAIFLIDTYDTERGARTVVDLAGKLEPEGLLPRAVRLDSGDINALSLVPRVSLRDGRAKVQRGEDLEIGYSRKEGSRTYRVSAYRERVTNAALTIVAPGGFYVGGDILPDLFSSSSIFDAGNYQTLGYTASVTQSLGDDFKVTAMYGSVGVLVPQSDQLSTDNPEELRSLIHASRRNAVTARGSGTVPRIGTHFIASYQWMDQSAVTPAHMYSTQSIRPEPGLNIYVRQPIPTFFSLPWRMEASADLRNLLAQGYLPMSFADGRRLLLVQTPRSFRGGLSFIF